MKKTTLGLLLLLCAGNAAQAELVAMPALGSRYKQTRERADVLFGSRDAKPPAPEAALNLFRSSSGISPVRPTPSVNETPRVNAPPDEIILQEALAALKKGGGGLVTVGSRVHLTFNQKVYKDGDTLLVPVRGRSVEIHIVRISTSSVILSLNDNEVVWWF